MEEPFVRWIRTGEITFKHARGMRDVIGREIHTYHELFYLIDGQVELVSETGSEALARGTAVVIPKETFHQFVLDGPENSYERCVFNFDAVAELDGLIGGRCDRLRTVRGREIDELFLRMQGLGRAAYGEEERTVLTKALLAELLVLLGAQGSGNGQSVPTAPVTREAVAYVNAHLGDELTLAVIAGALHVSPSQLAHTFCRDLRIPVHKYVLEKRLVLASRLIAQGQAPTQVALACGFRDYSGFYRRYKAMFGMTPSEARRLPPQT